jgi:hypothetical protein
VKMRGIIFSTSLVPKLLDDSKRVTRRTVKPQPESVEGAKFIFSDGLHVPCRDEVQRGALDQIGPGIRCPYGMPGDQLWVRETHAQFAVGNRTHDAPLCVAYRATCSEDGGFDYVDNGGEVMRIRVTKWTPAIHMPRWASRITLAIDDVRVERLQDIMQEDALREGVQGASLVRREVGRVARRWIMGRESVGLAHRHPPRRAGAEERGR